MKQACARAEILAGAVALGEATDPERDEFRRHIAACSSCLTSIGGEREIERTMAIVAEARESEVWDPAPVAALARSSRVARAWGYGLSAALFALAASLGIHTIIAAQVRPMTIAAASREPRFDSVPFHATIERRVQPVPQPTAASLKQTVVRPNFVVVHNVITLKHPTHAGAVPTAPAQTTVVAESVNAQQSDVPVWRRDEAMPQATKVSNDPQTPAPLLQGRAESIAVAPSYVIRDVSPLGGDTAINPRPPMIAYDIGAQGTTAFEVSVDERGAAVKCTITKSSGFAVLDSAVCKAAMKARYSPRTINGRAVVGVYRDAFTFRSENSGDSIEPPQ